MTTNKDTALIIALYNCAAACDFCTTACLGEADVTMMAACIKLDIDCAQLCSTTASFLSRNSVHGKHLLKECAELCNLCASECEKHTQMQHCKDCATACRNCETACNAAA